LLPYARHRLPTIVAALVALAVASAATLTVPQGVRRMIDFGFRPEHAGIINAYFTAMLGVVAVLAVASGTRYFLVMTLGERIVADLRRDLFAHLSRLDASFYDRSHTGELLSRLTADATQLKAAFGSSASVALRNLFLFLGAVAMMVVSSPKLSALVLGAIPIIVLPLVFSGRSVGRRSRRAQDKLAEANTFAAEHLGAVRVMQAFGAEAATRDRFGASIESAYAATRSAVASRALLTSVAIVLAFASVVAVLWLGAHDVIAGRMTGGLLSQFVLYAILAATALGELSQVWSEVSAAAGAAGRIAELLAVVPAITAPPEPLFLPTPVRGAITFEDVTFAYPTRPEHKVFDGLTLSIRPGERVAIVGPSGAGKTTLFQLIMRFYDPQSGRVAVDGIPVDALDPAALRRTIALVPQDPTIFSVSIAENIGYGTEAAGEAAIREASRQAAADAFISGLPKGYDTKVGERGITLSGGQRQRLAIARAILKDAQVLLLDEATSALDAENERLVQAALHRLMEHRTSLVIAHRLATVVEADRILVLDRGRLVEQGTHAELLAKNGLYARLARLQFGAEVPAEAAE
jgi:ATP-binding cassette, subfamily B, bacterial